MRYSSWSALRSLGLVVSIALAGCYGAMPNDAASPEAPVGEAPFFFPEGTIIVAASSDPPVQLTASDGSGLTLVSLSARAVIEDPLAFTEITLVFENPEDRVREGTFMVTLPPSAALSRLAMKIGNEWQEGEVVEKQRAREAYEDFLHRKQDPLLVEQAAGNQVSARVFPIPARGKKEIVFSYSQVLSGGDPYTLPLKGLPVVGAIDVDVRVAGAPSPAEEIHLQNAAPKGDLVVSPKLVQKQPGVRAGEFVAARVTPMPDASPDPYAPAIILVDTSGSRALGFEEQLRTVAGLVKRIGEVAGAATRVAVVCFDQEVDPIFQGDAGSFGDREIDRMRRRRAFGASDPARAIAWAEEHAAAAGYKRVIVLGDGVATAGEDKAADLGKRVARLKKAGIERVDAIAFGGVRDDAALRRMVRAGLARDGVVVEGNRGLATIERRLTQATRSGLAVKVDGARWSHPKIADGIQPGDEIVVLAEMPEGLPVKVTIGDATAGPLELAEGDRALVERAVAGARIEALLDEEAARGSTEDTRKRIIALSTGYRVLSPYTALLVLETDDDYKRFGLDPASLSDITTLRDGRVARASRPGKKWPSAPPAPRVGFRDPAPREPDLTVRNQRPPVRSASRAMRMGPPPVGPVEPSIAPRAAASARRNDPMNARGNMWGAEIGDSFGAGGLGLSGIGEGSGGRGTGIGLGSVGTVGHGAGRVAPAPPPVASAAPTQRPPAGNAAAPPPPPRPRSNAISPPAEARYADAPGFGSGHGRLGGSHATRPPQIRASAVNVSGRLPPEVIQRIVRQNMGRLRAAYEQSLASDPSASGRMSVRFVIGADGSVTAVSIEGSSLPRSMEARVMAAFRAMKFPAPEAGAVTVVYPMVFSPGDGSSSPPSDASSPPPAAPPPAAPPPAAPPPPAPPAQTIGEDGKPRVEPYTGRFKDVMALVASHDPKALDAAFAWYREAPGDVMSLVALGEALEGAKQPKAAARVYGSIVDLFPARADLRRFVGARLERLGEHGLALASDTYRKAEDQRPDHPSSHRALAFAELKRGRFEAAFEAIARGLDQKYPPNRFAGVEQILREDLGLVGAAWVKAEPSRAEQITARIHEKNGKVEDAPSLRFVLTWETDANDVDFHVYDATGEHAYYKSPHLLSGGDLYADVTTGYGPECFTVRLPREGRSKRYSLAAHYYARGPMGYGMGRVQIIDHDGAGGLTFEERPFVVMTDHAYVELGSY